MAAPKCLQPVPLGRAIGKYDGLELYKLIAHIDARECSFTMRIVIICLALSALCLGQSPVVAEGSLAGGSGGSFSIEVSEGSGRLRLSRVPVHADSSFRIEIPGFGQSLEFRVLNFQGDVVQIVHHSPQRGVPIELRLDEVSIVSTVQGIVSLRRLTFHPSSKSRRAFSESQKLRSKGKNVESLAAFHEIVRSEPEWFEAWVELATGQAVLGENAAAAESLRQALGIDPNASEVYPSLGFALLRSGRMLEAGQIAQKGLSMNPNSLKSKYVLGLAKSIEAEPSPQAVALLEEVQSHFPDAMLPLASLLLRLGQFEASRDAAWRYLHMAKSPRVEVANAIWREASQSLHSPGNR